MALHTITVVLHPRSDALPHSYHAPTDRHNFERRHGAHPGHIAKVVGFLKSHNLSIIKTHVAAKQITATGTLDELQKAFGVKFKQFVRNGVTHRIATTATLPDDIKPLVLAVSGLSSHPGPKKSHARKLLSQPDTDPGGAAIHTVDNVCTLYSFPTNNATGQTIGLLEFGNSVINAADVNSFFTGGVTSSPAPTIKTILAPNPVDATSESTPIEANLDACIIGAAAPGATIAVYYVRGMNTGLSPSWGNHTNQDILDCITRMVHPLAGDAICSVLSISWSGFGVDEDFFGDLPDALALSSVWHDAANLGITVCISSGDSGNEVLFTGQMPSIHNNSPLTLSVGGTSLASSGNTITGEWVWQDNDTGHGTTGGGVSRTWGVPSYQTANGVHPTNPTNNNLPGRGTPDVALNSAPISGYKIWINGTPGQVGGTSAAAPLMASLIARINASLGRNVGFINPIIYAHPTAFRDILPNTGAADNAFSATFGGGYPAGTGWDACTGLGAPIGTTLLSVLSSAAVIPTILIQPIFPNSILTNSPFTVTGWLTGYTSPPTLTYADDSGSFVALPSGAVVSVSGFSFTHPGMAAGTHTFRVQDSAGHVTTSNTFAAFNGPPTITLDNIPNQTVASGALGISVTVPVHFTNFIAVPPAALFVNDFDFNNAVQLSTIVTTSGFSLKTPPVGDFFPGDSFGSHSFQAIDADTFAVGASNIFQINGTNPTGIIDIDFVDDVLLSQSFTVTGKLRNYGSRVPVLQYSTFTGNHFDFPPNAIVTSTSFSLPLVFTSIPQFGGTVLTIQELITPLTSPNGEPSVTSNIFNVRPGITVNTIPSVAANTSFTVSGSLIGYTSAPTLQWAVEGTNFTTISAANVTSTSYSFSHPGLPAGSHHITVEQFVNTGSANDGLSSVFTASNQFTVGGVAQSIAINAIPSTQANTSFNVSGTLVGYTSTPVLTFGDDANALVALPSGSSVSNTSFSFQNPGLAAGAHTVRVQDSTGVNATSNSFTVQPAQQEPPAPTGHVQYIVSQSSSANGPWTPVPGSPFTTLTDTVSGLTPGTTYFFQIIAQDTVYNVTGPPSVIGPITTVASGPTESPQGTVLTNTTGTIVDSSLGVWSLVVSS